MVSIGEYPRAQQLSQLDQLARASGFRPILDTLNTGSVAAISHCAAWLSCTRSGAGLDRAELVEQREAARR